MKRSSVLRRAALPGCGLIAAIGALLLSLGAFAVLAPFTSAPIPASCTDAVSHLPPSRTVRVPGVGDGTLLAGAGNTSVVIVATYGRSPFEATAYILSGGREPGVRSLRLSSDVVAAAVSDGIVYLFNDKIGYLLGGSNAEPLGRLLESDNYRGLYTSGGTRYLQMDAEISALGLNGSLFWHRTVQFAGIAYGCYVAPPTN